MNSEIPTIDEPRERMPVDPRTLLIGVWKCRWALAVWAIFSLALAFCMALTIAPRVWTSEAVLLYQPPSDELLAGMYKPPTIHTQLNMVKVKPNLAETRMRLKLDCTLPELGAACRIVNPRDSQLLVCEVSWDKPEQVAEVANTLTDVFIQRQERLRRMELAGVIREMDSRLAMLRQKLKKSGRLQNDESVARKRELESYRNRINTADEMYEKALTELKAAERKVAELAAMEDNLRNSLLTGNAGAGQSETISSLNIRVERIREEIMDLRAHQQDDLTSIQWEERMRFNERLLTHGFISKEAFEHEQAEYEKHLTRSVDSPRIAELKQELKDIYERMRPNSPEGVESAPMVQALSFERYQLLLELSAAKERVVQLEQSRVRLHDDFQRLAGAISAPEQQPPHLIESWVAEARQLEEALAKIRAVADSNASDFEYVSHAARPTYPTRSYRKVVFAGVSGFAMVIGVVGALFAQLINPTIRSAADASIKLERDDVAVLPELTPETKPMLAERIRALAERVRAATTNRGARVLVGSAEPGAGRSLVARELADCVARRGETVVVIDASIREARGDELGLSDFLARDEQALSKLIAPDSVPGVFHIARGRREVVPDLLASARMSTLLDELSAHFDLVIIDGPACESNSDADVLARFSDGVLLVVKADRSRGRDVRQAAQRLETAGAPVISLVLNHTAPEFVKG